MIVSSSFTFSDDILTTKNTLTPFSELQDEIFMDLAEELMQGSQGHCDVGQPAQNDLQA